jgi:hypothetical protein
MGTVCNSQPYDSSILAQLSHTTICRLPFSMVLIPVEETSSITSQRGFWQKIGIRGETVPGTRMDWKQLGQEMEK